MTDINTELITKIKLRSGLSEEQIDKLDLGEAERYLGLGEPSSGPIFKFASPKKYERNKRKLDKILDKYSRRSI